nr:hypothetical protein [Tanacetum cinerariifolium]
VCKDGTVGSPAAFRAVAAPYEKDVDLEFVPIQMHEKYSKGKARSRQEKHLKQILLAENCLLQMDVNDENFKLVDLNMGCGCGYGGGGQRIHDDSSYRRHPVDDSILIEVKGSFH